MQGPSTFMSDVDPVDSPRRLKTMFDLKSRTEYRTASKSHKDTK